MGPGEEGTAQVLREHRSVADPIVVKHGGRIVKTTGVYDERPRLPIGLAVGAAGHAPRDCGGAFY